MELNAVDRESQEKLYVQILNILRGKIERGEWPNGSQIPTEDELCMAYEVSKSTVRLAVSELQRLGYLVRRQGRGTFVIHCALGPGMAVKTTLTDGMFGKGVRAEKEILARGVLELPEDVDSHLGCGGSAYRVLIRRSVDGVVLCLDESFIPFYAVQDVEGLDFGRASLFELLEEGSARRIHRVLQCIELSRVDAEAAAILSIDEGSPVILLHRLIMGPDGRPMAYNRLYGPGSKYKFQTEFERIR